MTNEAGGERMTRRWKLVTTAVICYCTFTFGLGTGLLGPSLLELSRKFETDIRSISKAFTVSIISFLIGATLSGVAFNHINRQIATSVLVLVMGIGILLIPFMPSVPSYFGVIAIFAFGAAGYSTSQIVWVIEMWESNAAVYIQMQHFTYALGTFVSPLLLKLFLSQDVQPEEVKTESDILGRVDNDLGVVPKSEESSSLLYVSFLIGGCGSIFGGLLIMVLYWIKKYEKPIKNCRRVGQEDSSKNGISVGIESKRKFRKVLLVIASALLLGFYQAMELSSFQFLPTFTHFIDLKLSTADGALVLSGLAAAYTVGRGAGIIFALKIRPEIILLGNTLLTIVGNTLLFFFANSSVPVLWGGAILLGIGYSTFSASFYGYIEKHLKVSNVVGSVFIVTSGFISIFYPIIIGGSLEGNPFVLMHMNYLSLGLCIAFFVFIHCITRETKGQETEAAGEKAEEKYAYGEVTVETQVKI